MKLLIERFKENRLSGHEGRPGTTTAQMEDGMYREIDRSIKYRFTNSALAMLFHLYHSPLRVDMPVAASPAWIEFHSPFTLDAYRTDLDLPTVQCMYFSRHIPESIHPFFKTVPQKAYLRSLEDAYDLEMLPPKISPKYSLRYTASSHQWTFPIPYHCPVNECVTRQLDGPFSQSVQGFLHEPCMYCLSAKGKFSRLFTFALAMVRGDFAEVPDQHFPIEMERVIHKVPGKGGKLQTQALYHQYHLVSFDACIKSKTALEELRMAKQTLSWLELAKQVDPNSIFYILRSITEKPRTFHHERFVNMRGQTILVKGHEKHVPMKVGTMKVVKASAFETR